jgi:hypothetical protein
LIASAIALLALAVVGALIPFNVVGLAISIASVLTVSIFLIPAMRAELRAFDTCMGPSTNCSVGPNIDLLGQVASIVSAVAFIAALALEISAIAAIATIFFAWIGLTLEAGAALLKYSGIVASATAGLILVGLLTNVRNYEACRRGEVTPPTGTGTGGLGSGTTAAGMLAELCAPSAALTVQRGAVAQVTSCYMNTGTVTWLRGSATQVNLATARAQRAVPVLVVGFQLAVRIGVRDDLADCRCARPAGELHIQHRATTGDDAWNVHARG